MQRRAYILRNGLFLFILLGLYFLFLDLLGWTDNFYLRLVNYVFIFFILRNTIKHTIVNRENYPIQFLISMFTVGMGITLSIVALFFYLYALGPSIERYDILVMTAHSYLQLCLALLIESLSSSIILVFIMLQFYKNRKPVVSEQEMKSYKL